MKRKICVITAALSALSLLVVIGIKINRGVMCK